MVRLVLAVGQHDPDFVDAYYGPAEWKPGGTKTGLDVLAGRAGALREDLSRFPAPSDDMERLRYEYLSKQLAAVSARVRMLQGERLSFDDESRSLYDATAPALAESHFQQVLEALDKRFPGSGPLVTRYQTFRRAFTIPKDRLDHVFKTASAACRQRTQSTSRSRPTKVSRWSM